jgi:hypothetical protein
MSLLSTPDPDSNRLPNIIPVEFTTEYRLVEGTGEVVPRDFVRWTKRGSNGTTEVVDEIARIRKPLGMTDDFGNAMPNPTWQVIQPHYEAWKRGQEIPENGTPLESWPMLNKPQIKVLRGLQFRSVEDLASVTDTDLGRIRLPNARLLRDRAKQFIDARRDTSTIDKAMSARDAEVAALKAERDEDRKLIEQMAAQLKTMQPQPQQAEPAPMIGDIPTRRHRN